MVQQIKSTPNRVYSVHALQRDREFAGEIEALGGKTYPFTFAPKMVVVAGRKIELVGDFRAGAGKRAISGVRATLASTQGGMGRAPVVHRELLAGTAQGAETGTADPQEKTEPPAAPRAESKDGLPITEVTGAGAFVGVMYFKLSSLDGRALGVPADLGGVQLNARLSPTSETERELQWLYSGLVAAAWGEPADAKSTSAHVAAINRILKGEA